MKQAKKWKRAAAWLGFFLLFLVICVLSFQSGSATKELEKPFVSQVTGQLEEMPDEETVLTITYYIRQAGRAVLFWLLGLFWGAALRLTWVRGREIYRAAVSCAVLFGISYFTEKMKIFIEGRHYVFTECLESFLFGMLGYVCICAISMLIRRRSGQKRSIADTACDMRQEG